MGTLPGHRRSAEGEEQARLHRELLPLDELGLGTDGVLARIAPSYQRAQTGTVARFLVTVTNPRQHAEALVDVTGAGSA
ncbi:MAG: hypothetical protein IRZ05_00535 [Micromonosporaceae bacterium]|nr:hypothetical protein [Micromonosporaceae bacterium]